MDDYSEDENEDEDEEDDAIERPTVRDSIPEVVDFQNMVKTDTEEAEKTCQLILVH